MYACMFLCMFICICVCMFFCMYVCVVITYNKSKYQPGKVTNSACGQLNRKNDYFPVPVRAREFGLARRVRQSRPASACSFSTLRLNLMFTYGIPPDFRGGVHLFYETAIRPRVSPEFIGSCNCVPIAFTAESPQAQGQ